MIGRKSKPDDVKRGENLIALWHYGCYVPLLIPIILFLGSLYIPPKVFVDSGVGFLALRSMLEGGAFNSITAPDPANIANDVAIFLTWWSPGQYLVPGLFIWLGTNYGLAVSLTTLIATLIGVAGWIQVARSFAVSSFVLFIFVLGLNTFPYVTDRFLMYWGGEVLLFAAAPWSLYAMRWAADKQPILCFTISLLSAVLLFFAKLTGLVVFASNVTAISLVALVNKRRLDSSTTTMWVASAIAALCFMVFWEARGPIPAGGSTPSFSWYPMGFSATAAAFSGIYGLNLFFRHPWLEISFQWYQWGIELLALFGLLLMVWAWYRLRHTRYRDMAVLLLAIILIYAITIAAAIYLSKVNAIPLDERYFRYAGILFFLLLLTAIDQWRVRFAKGIACLVFIVLGLYGLRNYATFAYAQMRVGNYDPMTGISQDISPAILEYMRSEVARHDFQRPIVVIPSPLAGISLPRSRIIHSGLEQTWEHQLPAAPKRKWFGRAEKIFIVVPEEMLLTNEAEAIMRSFADYDFDNWSQMKLGGMIIYTQ